MSRHIKSTSGQMMTGRGRNSTWTSTEEPMVLLPIGTMVADRYKVLEYLGSGASAAVYKCRDTLLGNLEVAVKIIPNDLITDEVALRRLYRELMTNFDFDHPNIARFYDCIRGDNYVGLVMEYVAGGSLGSLFDSGHIFEFDEIRTILVQICIALEVIHSGGIVHRDMKLENVLFTREGIVKVADFGLAKEHSDPSSPSTPLKSSGDFSILRNDQSARSLTATGGIAGSPLYLAPEYISNGTVTALCDIYAIGIIGYQLIAGSEPYPCEDLLEMFKAKLQEKPVPLLKLRPDAPWELCAIIDQALEIDPKNRFQDIRQMRYALERLKINGNLLTKNTLQKSGGFSRPEFIDEPGVPIVQNTIDFFANYGQFGFFSLSAMLSSVSFCVLIASVKTAQLVGINLSNYLPAWIAEMYYYLS